MANEITREECSSTHIKLMEKIDTLVGVVNDIKVSIAGLPQQILNSADDRYASKKTEQAVDKVFWLVISAVVIAILGAVLK